MRVRVTKGFGGQTCEIATMPMNGESIKNGDGDRVNTKPGGVRTNLSNRGKRALAPFSPYIRAVNDAKKNPWSLTNPDGYFVVLH